jgi:hypothetical protein
VAEQGRRGPGRWLVLLGCIVVAGGTAVGGYLAGQGVLLSRLQDRYVTVKGVAEVELKADLAVMPLRFTVTAGDVRDGQAQVEAITRTVAAFLKTRGFAEAEIAPGRVEVQDRTAQGMERNNPATRYVLNRTVTVRSPEVDKITALDGATGDLLRAGVVLGGGEGPSYIVTAERLNAVKPDLIRRATEAARKSADEFAVLSGSAIGAIRRANQGVIVIQARDPGENNYEPHFVDKRIRAVATVDYYLGQR